MLRKLIAAACLALLGWLPMEGAFAQTNTATTTAAPIKITTGLTYQQVMPLVQSNNRHSISIQNNNATDNCELIIVGAGSPWLAGDTTATSRTINSVSMTGAQASILLLPGGSYTRYYPFIPSDQILGTCASTGDSLYVDTQ